MKYATCHPHLRHKAKGLCSACYTKSRSPEKQAEIAKYNAEYAARYRAENGDKLSEKSKAYQKDVYYTRLYGMTVDDVTNMLKAQNYCCAICSKAVSMKKKTVDHCHETGFVRGILCYSCNLAIGLLKESPELFNKAITYLAKPHTGFIAK